MKTILILFLAIIAAAYREHEIPLVKAKTGSYYLQLRIGGPQKPRVLFAIDFNKTQSYIDSTVMPFLPANKNYSLQVLTPRGRTLGLMNFTVLATNITWIEHKGIIGLGLGSHFIQMLQRMVKKSVSLRFQLLSSSMVIERHPCRNPKVGPFKVSMTTWTTVNYLTPLSLNFRPTQDFLALLNKTTNNFQMDTDKYHEKTIEVGCEDQERNIKIKRFIDCWSFQSTDNYECSVNTTSSNPDVGLAIFSFPVKVCKDGVDIGVTIIPTQSYYKYFLMILGINIILGLIFLNRQKVISCFAKKRQVGTESLVQQ